MLTGDLRCPSYSVERLPTTLWLFLAYLSSKGQEALWLGGRFLSAKWDVEELWGRKEEIVKKDLLKGRCAV